MISLVVLIVVLAIAATVVYSKTRQRKAVGLDEARAEAEHWYGRLSGQVVNLQGDGDSTIRQALLDASERYTAAGALRSSAHTAADFRSVSAVSVEGLHFIHAARKAMGLDPGPELPSTAAQSAAGQFGSSQSVLGGDGQSYARAPEQTAEHTFFYPGGVVGGRSVPGGWYSQPFWKGAALGGIAAVGGALLLGGIADTLIGGGLGGDRWGDDQSTFGDDQGGGDW